MDTEFPPKDWDDRHVLDWLVNAFQNHLNTHTEENKKMTRMFYASLPVMASLALAILVLVYR